MNRPQKVYVSWGLYCFRFLRGYNVHCLGRIQVSRGFCCFRRVQVSKGYPALTEFRLPEKTLLQKFPCFPGLCCFRRVQVSKGYAALTEFRLPEKTLLQKRTDFQTLHYFRWVRVFTRTNVLLGKVASYRRINLYFWTSFGAFSFKVSQKWQ